MADGQLGKCEMELSEPHQGMRFEVEVLKDDPVSNSSRTNSVALSEEEIDATFFGQEFRQRTGTTSSQVTQSDLSRLGMLTAISDAGSLFGSSVLLSSPSYLTMGLKASKEKDLEVKELASLEYLDTIMENAEYIDTVRGKLPLAEAAKMIAQDRSKQDELFTEAHISKVRKQCYRKLICVGFSFACLFSTFFCLRNLQSSNSGDDPILGLITFGCLTCLTWFGVLAAASVIYYLRPKWCLVIASVPCMLYTAANFYPSKATLIPAALLSGLGIGMLWSSEGIYMINLAATYALVSKKPMIEVIGKFNGVVFTMYQSSHLIGNLLSSLILGDMIEWFPKTHSATDVDIAAAVSNGTSELPIKLTTQACGLNFALSSQVVNRFNQVDPRQNIILLSVLMAIAFLGFLNLVLLLKPLNTVKASVSSSLLQNLRSFVKMFADVKSWLLVPFMMYPGISGSIAMADYTKAFITCAYGVGYIGYILMAGAVFSFLGALISGRIIHRTGRIPVFLFATLSTLVSLCMMLLWQPRSDHFDFKAFIPVCLWCLSDGIILTQINGFLGEIFRKELTYALCMLHLCYGIGASFGTLSSAYSWLSLSHKLYFTIAEVMLAFVLFLILEVLIKKNKV